MLGHSEAEANEQALLRHVTQTLQTLSQDSTPFYSSFNLEAVPIQAHTVTAICCFSLYSHYKRLAKDGVISFTIVGLGTLTLKREEPAGAVVRKYEFAQTTVELADGVQELFQALGFKTYQELSSAIRNGETEYARQQVRKTLHVKFSIHMWHVSGYAPKELDESNTYGARHTN